MLISSPLTPHPPAMPFGNRKVYFIGSFQFSIVTIQKISPRWKPEIELSRHFPKFKSAYFSGKILPISRKLNITPNTLGCYGLKVTNTHSLGLTFVHKAGPIRLYKTRVNFYCNIWQYRTSYMSLILFRIPRNALIHFILHCLHAQKTWPKRNRNVVGDRQSWLNWIKIWNVDRKTSKLYFVNLIYWLPQVAASW